MQLLTISNSIFQYAQKIYNPDEENIECTFGNNELLWQDKKVKNFFYYYFSRQYYLSLVLGTAKFKQRDYSCFL